MPVGAVIPAIPAPLECILECERGTVGPDPMLGAARTIEQDCEGGLLGTRNIACQDLQHGVAVVERPMSVVEQAVLREQVSEASAVKTIGLPVRPVA